jgi:hypothetical protein
MAEEEDAFAGGVNTARRIASSAIAHIATAIQKTISATGRLIAAEYCRRCDRRSGGSTSGLKLLAARVALQ